MTAADHLPRLSPGAQRMRRYRRRREAGQQCITLTLHEYQVWTLVGCGYLAKDQRQSREAVADALRAYLREWAMPPFVSDAQQGGDVSRAACQTVKWPLRPNTNRTLYFLRSAVRNQVSLISEAGKHNAR